MADGIVTGGTLGVLAQVVARKLRRRVTVHRVESKINLSTLHRRKVGTKTEIRYSISIEGCHPSVFFGMTVNEAKARLAMLSDMLSSGVITSGTTGVISGSGNSPEAGPDAAGRDRSPIADDGPQLEEDKPFGEERGDEGGY